MDEMQILTTRVDKIEIGIASDLKEIFIKLEALSIAMASRRDCPKPGLCLQLKDRIDVMEADKRDLARDIISIQKWQAGIMAALVLLGIIITFFGPVIRHTLGIPQ
jgi:hypothetical protein